jgi:two-component system response regulator MprA
MAVTRMTNEHATDTAYVLIVDDDAQVRRSMRWALESEGWLVEMAADGEQALARAAEHRPAVVLLDMTLPLLDGDGVAAGLRTLYGATLPIVVITADGHAAVKARRVGAVSFVPKPFEIDHLIAAVYGALDAA